MTFSWLVPVCSTGGVLRSWMNYLKNPEEMTVNGTKMLVFTVDGKVNAFLQTLHYIGVHRGYCLSVLRLCCSTGFQKNWRVMSQYFLKHCLLLWLCPKHHLRGILSQRVELLLINCTSTNKHTNKQKPGLKLKISCNLRSTVQIPLFCGGLLLEQFLFFKKIKMCFYNFLFLLLQQSQSSKSEIAFHQKGIAAIARIDSIAVEENPLEGA